MRLRVVRKRQEGCDVNIINFNGLDLKLCGAHLWIELMLCECTFCLCLAGHLALATVSKGRRYSQLPEGARGGGDSAEEEALKIFLCSPNRA